MTHPPNHDPETVKSFGEEWSRFRFDSEEAAALGETFNAYFALMPWRDLPNDVHALDLGCGTGRWARFVAPRVASLHCIDASSQALEVAMANLSGHTNCTFEQGTIEESDLHANSLDLIYSLGVLHHIPQPQLTLDRCWDLLKPNSPILIYVYYDLGNRPLWYRWIWRLSDHLRNMISSLPSSLKDLTCDGLAFSVYYPLARLALLVEALGGTPNHFPLSAYRQSSLYVMRNDSRDRFGTKLETRFSRDEVRLLLESSGFEHVEVSTEFPFWTAIGWKPGADRSKD
jgi:SAM-dependent methyltransferase